jgi:hypothetical protein
MIKYENFSFIKIIEEALMVHGSIKKPLQINKQKISRKFINVIT